MLLTLRNEINAKVEDEYTINTDKLLFIRKETLNDEPRPYRLIYYIDGVDRYFIECFDRIGEQKIRLNYVMKRINLTKQEENNG